MKAKSGAKNLRNKILGIFFFVFIASVFGIFNKFSKDYTYELPFQIRYNIPPNRFLVNNPPKLLKIEVKGTGWHLFFENVDNIPRLIEYNCSQDLEQKVTRAQLIDSISSYVNKYSLRVSDINPDEIPITLSPAISKKVKIIQPIKATFYPSYGLIEPMKLSDSVITIYGSKESLQEINDIELDTITFDNLKENKKIQIKLPFSTDQYIRFEKEVIELELKVDQFTQKTFNLPLQLKNFPQRKNFEFLPKEVSVSIEIPLQRYNLVTEKDFEVQINYYDIQRTSNKRLIPVSITKASNKAKNVTVRPMFVEVIEIQK